MLKSLEIERLRGIRQGQIDDFAPLSVLVGQNGSGKSTVLDALLIGCSDDFVEAVGTAVRRRAAVDFGAPWLFWHSGRDAKPALIGITLDDNEHRLKLELDWTDPKIDRINVSVPNPQVEQERAGHVIFSQGNSFSAYPYEAPSRLIATHLVEATRGKRLDRLLTEAINAGRRRAVESLLGEVVPGLVSVMMLTDKAGSPEVHFEFDWGSVPVALAGDGLHALTRLVYELATPKDALLLVEEPEIHMHPRALDAAARAMVETVKRGNQIVVSTHNLDLIDDLIRAADTAGMLDQLAVFRTAIVDGELRTSRFPGPEAQFARDQIEEDLR